MPALDSSRAIVLTDDVGVVTLLMQWQGPGVRAAPGATYEADVLAAVLNDPDSRFSRRLIDEGPFQTAGLGYATLVHTGPVSFIGTTTVEQLPVALSVLASELAMLRSDDYFDPRALATAAKRRRVQQSFEREEGVTLAHSLAFAWSVTGLPYHATYADSLAARRPPDLTRFVAKYVTGRPFVLGVLVPRGRDQEIALMVQQFMDFMREDR
jgi:predicted Zn-dependent peptidase